MTLKSSLAITVAKDFYFIVTSDTLIKTQDQNGWVVTAIDHSRKNGACLFYHDPKLQKVDFMFKYTVIRSIF